MSWLITGGCGFIGSNLADALLADGEEVVVLDNMSRVGSVSNRDWLRGRYGQGWRCIEGDTRDAELIAALVCETKPRQIAHLAGQVAMTTSLANPRLDFEVNVLGTFNVLEAVRLHSPDTQVMYSSTNKVYGALDYLPYEETATRYTLPGYPAGLDESLQLDGHSPYGCSKLAADQYVRDYHRMYGLATVVFRHSSMYGGRQFATYDQGWVGWFCQQALAMHDPTTPSFTISGDGKQVRDVLHSSDLIRAYRNAAQRRELTAGHIYNIGGGMRNSLSLLELFALLESFTGDPLRFRRIDWREGDQKVFVADARKAEHELAWVARMTTEDGIRQMLSWCREITHVD